MNVAKRFWLMLGIVFVVGVAVLAQDGDGSAAVSLPWDEVAIGGLTIGALVSCLASLLKRFGVLHDVRQVKLFIIGAGLALYAYHLVFTQGMVWQAGLAQAFFMCISAPGVYELIFKPLGVRYILEKAGREHD